ncbi:EutN/CcmL family microcompartment protein [Poriferisphaera sp. WC338]|uniref:EutN/CcmL family microcompartment protein n=1 Tax=Poriferisphaera sp. WC338 TaxID=3425129 RepID=UPI003D81997C
MFLGRVQGHIVATAKDPAISGQKLLMIEPLKVDYVGNGGQDGKANGFSATGRAIVAMDMIGAGEGQLVLIVQGSSARMADGCNKLPTDAVVVGIVDEAVVMGKKIS